MKPQEWLGRAWRALALLARTRSVAVTRFALRAHAAALVLDVVERGAELRVVDSTLEVTYRNQRFHLSKSATASLRATLFAVDDGLMLSDAGPGRWYAHVPGGAIFEVRDCSLASDLSTIRHRFVVQEYDFLSVAGARVIDIGANIGDSAVYFALNGARTVCAFEPFHQTWSQAERNVRLNGLDDRVHVHHLGVARARGERTAIYQGFYSVLMTSDPDGSQALPGGQTETIRLVSLAEALEMCAALPGDRTVWKIDCEGCEREIFGEDFDSGLLKDVDQIAVEFHNGNPLPIMRVLRSAGFKISFEFVRLPYGMIFGSRSEYNV
jgi:FkbM family methyltransferase